MPTRLRIQHHITKQTSAKNATLSIVISRPRRAPYESLYLDTGTPLSTISTAIPRQGRATSAEDFQRDFQQDDTGYRWPRAVPLYTLFSLPAVRSMMQDCSIASLYMVDGSLFMLITMSLFSA